MDISKWSLDKIMQLPDWCFGRRWWIGEYLGSTTGVVDYRIGEENLPDKFVVWGILISCRSPACLEAMRVTVRLGTVLPVHVDDLIPMDRIYKGISVSKITYEFFPDSNGVKWIDAGRIVHESKGRKLVIVANGDQVIQYEMTVGMLLSSVPREVPNWLSGM